MNGKGSKRRPSQVPDKQVEKNWGRIFGSPVKGNTGGLYHHIQTKIIDAEDQDNT